MDAPRPTRGVRRTDLEEILVGLRRALVLRDESPGGDWVEETASDLSDGTKPGWYLPPADGGGVAFYARRASEAYGHIHCGTDPDAIARGARLANILLESLPPDIVSVTLGFTGLTPPDERACAHLLGERSGSTVIERLALERRLSAADGGEREPPPSGSRLVAIRDVTLEALVDLDRRAFDGTFDALLVGAGTEGYRRALEAMLEGRVGRFVDEASVAIVETEPVRLVGALLTTEQSIRRATLVDFVVDPDRQRRGLGRYLMRWGLRALWALGYESARLWVTEANRPARGLYDEFSFRSIGEATIYRWDRPAAPPQPQDVR